LDLAAIPSLTAATACTKMLSMPHLKVSFQGCIVNNLEILAEVIYSFAGAKVK
jgi:hypothetical protein